jgi:hypothetical protein
MMMSAHARRHSGQMAAPLRTTTPAMSPPCLRQKPHDCPERRDLVSFAMGLSVDGDLKCEHDSLNIL